MKLATLMSLVTSCLMVPFLFPAPVGASVGGFVDNGADDHSVEEGAWFVNGGPVRWCLYKEYTSELNERQVARIAGQAFKTWERYVAQKKPFASTAPGFDLRFQFIGVCDGSEDLTLFVGTQTQEIRAERAKYTNPYSFAKRTRYERAKGRGKGYIWVHPAPHPVSWSTPRNLLGIFLHEIGHVLGCEHVDGTIMTRHLHNLLRKNKGRPRDEKDYWGQYYLEALGRIDFTKELFMNPTDGIPIWGFRGPAGGEELVVFQDLLGYQPKGPMSFGFVHGFDDRNDRANFYLMEVSPEGFSDPETGKLCFQKWVLEINLDPIVNLTPVSEARIFKVQKADGSIEGQQTQGYSRTGRLQTASGTEFDILYYRNQATDTVVHIFYRRNRHETYKTLFKASTLQQLGDQTIPLSPRPAPDGCESTQTKP